MISVKGKFACILTPGLYATKTHGILLFALDYNTWKFLTLKCYCQRVYPCSSFFNTLATRQKELKRASDEEAVREITLHLLHPLFNNLKIMCGEIDGVVLGSWTTVDEHSVASEVDDDSSHAAYWAAAAAWSDAWDQRVIDRVSHLIFIS